MRTFLLSSLLLLSLYHSASAAAWLRVLHGATDVGGIDIYLYGVAGNSPVFHAMTFGVVSNYTRVLDGGNTVDVTGAGSSTILLSAALTCTADFYYTVVVAGISLSTYQLITLGGDAVAVPANASWVRFALMSADAPPVDVLEANTGFPIYSNISFGSAGPSNSSWDEVAPDTYDVVLTEGGVMPALASANMTLSAGTSYTLVAYGPFANLTTTLLLDYPTNFAASLSISMVAVLLLSALLLS